MGCTNSKGPYVPPPRYGANADGTYPTKSNPLTEKEIQARIEAPKESHVIELGGVKYRYAYVSQRGYYPESPDKDNQDAYAVHPTFGNPADQQAFFAIFDGHGKDGHYCARFARDYLGRNILDKFSRVPAGGLNQKSIRQALVVAHNTTNDQMHADKRFDDSLSGTTAISILFRGKMMYISNVGDSRAIVVSKTDDGRLIAKPLSSDQTPYRKDERERIKKYGSRILSMDQIEGIEPIHENWGDLNLGEDIDEGGDPPRVWSPHGNYPGTAFTRSLGDMIAEECGVIAEPELLEREVAPNDQFIVIASDGVFEFLTNQMVADILARHQDPLDACKTIVQTAYDMWLQYEVRTDDISIIALYIDEFQSGAFDHSSSFYTEANSQKPAAGVTSPTPTSPAATTTHSAAVAALTSSPTASIEHLEARPVRRVMSREKKKNMIQLKSDDDDDNGAKGTNDNLTDEEIAQLVTAKKQDEEKVILSAMKSNFLFQHLNATQRTAVVGLMKPVSVKKGNWVIRQGDAGDKFYIVDSGRFEVRVKASAFPTEAQTSKGDAMTDEEKERIGGNVVHVYESGPDQHPGFGELSLMYGKPRAASVIALTDGMLWALDRRVFKRVVLRPKDIRREVIRILKKVELFKCLNVTQLQRLTDLLNERIYNKDDNIITQGEEGTAFYIIVSGNCDCSINQPNNEPAKVVMHLKDYDYFGERALLEAKPRAANVYVTSDTTKVLYIEKQAFEEVLGPLAQIIDEDRVRREALAAQSLSIQSTNTDNIAYTGLIVSDALGPVILGTFGKNMTIKHNVTIRSFNLTDINKTSINDSVVRFVEVAKLLRINNTTTSSNATISHFLPSCVSMIRQSNAVHLVFNVPIVADLSSFIRTYASKLPSHINTNPATNSVAASTIATAVLTSPTSTNGGSNGSPGGTPINVPSTTSTPPSPYLVYTIACITSALEKLHELNVVYRAIQPESIYVDAYGKIILMDFRFCKIGLFGSDKAFTICGASDYLSPEQIAQTGHGYPVDFWGMGVLLYELATGSHPFSSATEVATYSKITSFGTKTFPALKFSENISNDVKALINQLLVPTPEARIGFATLKKHPFFDHLTSYVNNSNYGVWEWINQDAHQSPLFNLAQLEKEEIIKEGLDQSVIDSFTITCDDPCEWLNSAMQA